MCATKEEEEALDHGSTCEREGVEIRERGAILIFGAGGGGGRVAKNGFLTWSTHNQRAV
jgi:hypothetical protein